MKRLTQETKKRLGILWVLLNVSTEYDYDVKKVVRLMDAITKTCPTAPKMWKEEFVIKQNGKTIFNWNMGSGWIYNHLKVDL